MEINRRQFSLLAAAYLTGCGRDKSGDHASADPPATPEPSDSPGIVDAGPLQIFQPNGVSDSFSGQGFFVVHEGHKLYALSSRCTHKRCRVRALEDGSFSCKCHGSKFDRTGKVVKGPATRDLPRLAVATDSRGHLMVDPTRPATAGPT